MNSQSKKMELLGSTSIPKAVVVVVVVVIVVIVVVPYSCIYVR